MSKKQAPKYNPKNHSRRLNHLQGERNRIYPAVYVVDTNPDFWIGLQAETTSAGDLILYRYSWEIESQPIAGVLIDEWPIICSKGTVITVIVKLLDRPGVEYHISVRDMAQKGIDVVTDFKGGLLLVPMEYFETHYRRTQEGK